MAAQARSWAKVDQRDEKGPSAALAPLVPRSRLQEVRLARGLRAPPCGWTLLVALVRSCRMTSLYTDLGASRILSNQGPGSSTGDRPHPSGARRFGGKDKEPRHERSC